MSKIIVKHGVTACFAAGCLLSSGIFISDPASAAIITITAEGLQNLEPIENYYNGGLGGFGSGPGPDYDITFGSDALALIDSDAGGSGNIANEPSGDTVTFFLDGPGVVMNVLNGFTTGFSFFYSSITEPGSVSVYDDFDGTGNLLATLNLTALGSAGNGDPTGGYDTWAPIGVAFSGVAKSVNFSGGANFIVFDDITLGSDIPGGAIPEPLTMLGVGTALGFGTVFKRQLSKKQKNQQDG